MKIIDKVNLIRTGIGLVILIAVTSAIYGWFFRAPDIRGLPVYINVPVEKEVIKIKKIPYPVSQVEVYEKERIIEKLKLPDWIKQDKDVQVIADGEVSAYKGKTSVVTYLNTKDGKANMLMKQKPLPFFSFEDEKEIGFRYGYNSSLKQDGELYGRWTFIRIGSFYSALYGEATTEPKAKAMLEVSYRF